MGQRPRASTSQKRACTQLSDSLQELLGQVRVLPRRMLLETPHVAATVPMLRGVWGAALRELDSEVYFRVFGPNEQTQRAPSLKNVPQGQSTLLPGYVLRPAPPDPAFAPAVDWILFGRAIGDNFTLCRAWDVASGMGLGSDRQRFHIRKMFVLMPDGSLAENVPEWSLDQASLLIQLDTNDASDEPYLSERELGTRRGTEAAERPCPLVFRSPIRLIRRGRLVQRPTWTDIVVAAWRRIGPLLPEAEQQAWELLKREAIEHSRMTRQDPFQGERLDLHRYSGRQRTEVEMQGVGGTLNLPDGPGALWPLLAAAQWLHVGKGTVMGLGGIEIHGSS